MPVEGGEREGQKQIAVAFPRDCYYKDGGSSQGRRVKSGSNGKIGGNKQLSFKTMSSVSIRSVNIIIYYIFKKKKVYSFNIHLIPKWWAINYSFVCMLISPLRLVNMYKKQKNFEVKLRPRGLINMQTKE